MFYENKFIVLNKFVLKIFLWFRLFLSINSKTNCILSNLKGLCLCIVRVSSDEVLQEQLRISEITCIIFVCLSVTSDECLLEIGWEPDPFLHVLTSEEMWSFLNKLIGSHLNVFIEKIATKYLFPVLGVEHLRMQECISHNSLCYELEVFIMEEHVVVVEEHEG